MSVCFSTTAQQRVYIETPATFGLFNNTAGAATIAGSNFLKFKRCVLTPDSGLLISESKTGTRSQQPGIPGKRGGRWELEVEWIPNGAAGVAPDIDPVLRAVFGQAPTIVASTSVTYNLSDCAEAINIYSFKSPSSTIQQAALGCLVDRCDMQIGQDIATATFSGPCIAVIDSVTFASQSSTAKGGLTAFPAEPGSPVSNGGIVPGFVGAATYDGNVMPNINTARLSIVIGNSLERAFGTYEPTIVGGAKRQISISTDIYDDNTAATTNLYTKAFSKAAFQISLLLGSVTGSKLTATLKGVQMPQQLMDDSGQRWQAKFGDSRASSSTAAAIDEFSLSFT